MIKLHNILNEGALNKKDVSYQLSIDYSGRTKPKVTKLNNKQLNVFYGYKVNPKDVIKSIEKLDPSIKLKHKAWSDIPSGGGVHSFIIESKITEGVPFPQDTPNEFAYSDFKKWAYKKRGKIKKQMQSLKGDGSKIFRAAALVWMAWAKAHAKEWTNVKDPQKFGRALVVMMVKDDLVFSKKAWNKNNKITNLK